MGLKACVGTKKELEQGEIRGGSGGQLGPLQAPVLHSLQRPVLYGATSRYRVNIGQRQQSILPRYSWDFTRSKASEHYSIVRSQGKWISCPEQFGEVENSGSSFSVKSLLYVLQRGASWLPLLSSPPAVVSGSLGPPVGMFWLPTLHLFVYRSQTPIP